MDLELCSNIDGKHDIIDSDPAVESFADVTFVPFTPGYYTDIDPHWGIFDANGELLTSTTYNRRAHRERIGISTHLSPKAQPVAAPDAVYVYGGPMIHHYGHFITATLPRFWLAFRGNENIKFLIHSLYPIRELFNLPYFAGIMRGLGLDESRIVTFFQPTAIRRLIVPAVSFEEQNFAHRVFGEMCRSIGRSTRPAGTVNEKPVFLSKKSLAGGVNRLSNESELENIFRQSDFDIAYPNLMSFADQVQMMQCRRIVIGTGSAHHTSIFSNVANAFISLVPSNVVISNFMLLDHLSGFHTLHVQPAGGCDISVQLEERSTFDALMYDTSPDQFDPRSARDLSQKTSGFLSVSAIPDPVRFARALVDIARRRRPF